MFLISFLLFFPQFHAYHSPNTIFCPTCTHWHHNTRIYKHGWLCSLLSSSFTYTLFCLFAVQISSLAPLLVPWKKSKPWLSPLSIQSNLALRQQVLFRKTYNHTNWFHHKCEPYMTLVEHPVNLWYWDKYSLTFTISRDDNSISSYAFKYFLELLS